MSHDPRIPDFPVSGLPNFGVSDIPIIGPMAAKVGRVFDLTVDPCGPSVDIWVTAFWWAAPKAFIAITKPDLVQIIQYRLGKPHKRNRRLRWKGAALDPFNWSVAQLFSPIPYQPRTFLWRLFTGYQRVAFFMMVADVGLDFTINWYSMAYAIAGCHDEDPHSWKGLPASPDVYPATGNYGALFWDFVWKPAFAPGSNNRIFAPLNTAHKLGVQLTAKRWAGSSSEAEITVGARLVHYPSGRIYSDAGTAKITGGDTVTLATSCAAGPLEAGEAYEAQFMADGDEIDINGSYFTCIPASLPTPFIGPDP